MALRAGRRRTSIVLIAAAVLVLLFGTGIARFYTDVLWFQEVGFSSVLYKSLGTQFVVGLAAGIAVAVLVWGNLVLAARLAPQYVLPHVGAGGIDPIERYRDVLGPHLRLVRLGIAVAIGFFTGVGASSAWRTYLLWTNRVEFGVADPLFDLDVGFYVFELPFYSGILSLAWTALLITLLLTAAAHYFHGSIRPEARLAGVTPSALAHISVLLGLLAVVKAAQYWLGRYELNFSPRGVVTGASYTDVNAQLPALTLLAVISIISAVLFLVTIRVRRIILPLAAVGIWILTAVLAGAAWPAWVQRFSVAPQEPQREGPYIARNIAATRAAYGLDDVTVRPFAATPDLDGEDVEENQALLDNVRLWDIDVLRRAYHQLQAIRPYYVFDDVDVDRYEIDGEIRQVLISARELSIDDLPPGSQSWANRHLQFTHGFGLISSLAPQTTPAGQPDFIVKDVPNDVASGAETLDLDQPRVYYGEAFGSTEYSIVNSQQEELDYPTDEGPERSQYGGEGGIEVRNFFRRIAFALREGDPNIVLSSLITNESRILLYKNVRDRVSRAAPFLDLDRDPYFAVVDGRPVWIVDAYTTTPWYPYSERFSMDEVLPGGTTDELSGNINYIRNSVKVVIDAYDGTMRFFVVDEDDPVISAWRGAFPSLFTDEEPSDDMRAHFRYPEDLFRVQSDVYLTYHIEDPADFYSQEDAWAIPENPRASDTGAAALLEPTYLLIQVGGEDQEFVLTRPFTPRRRPNMISFMAARSDPENYGELVLFQFPRQRLVLGPVQVDNLINQDVQISRTLALLDQRGSRVEFGSLIPLPIENSILYVQPIYVTAENVGIPELKRLILVLGERVVMQENFDAALAAMFDIEGVAEVEEEEDVVEPELPPEEAPPDLAILVQEAAEVFAQAQAALARGDFEEYGRLIEQLGDLLVEAENLSS